MQTIEGKFVQDDADVLVADIKAMNLDLLKLIREQCRVDKSRAIIIFGLKSSDADFLISSSIDDLKSLADKLIPGFYFSRKDNLKTGSDTLLSLLNSGSVFK